MIFMYHYLKYDDTDFFLLRNSTCYLAMKPRVPSMAHRVYVISESWTTETERKTDLRPFRRHQVPRYQEVQDKYRV